MNLPLPSAIPIIILLKDCNSNDNVVDDNHTWNNFYICEPLSPYVWQVTYYKFPLLVILVTRY